MYYENLTSSTMKNYAVWNDALFNYFFPTGNENPILYIDDNILKDVSVATCFTGVSDWGDHFLSSVLFNSDKINDFRRDYSINDGRQANTWTSFVNYLLENDLKIDETPSYFAVICAIMYVAQRRGAVHEKMKEETEKYLNYRPAQFAEFVDALFTQLNKDCPSFEHKRRVTLREPIKRFHISRIKFHLVLSKKDKDDFIDFIEINDLKWESGTYKEFADTYLLPALGRGNKDSLIDKIKKEENNTYFKSLLTQPNLQFGKQPQGANERQCKDVFWRYEFGFDFNTGDPVFLMTSGDVLEGIYYDKESGTFSYDNNCTDISDPLAKNVSLRTINDYNYIHNGKHYCLKNISSKNVFFFEKAGRDYFIQTGELQYGKHYIQFVPEKRRGSNNCPDGWSSVTDFYIDGFDVFETQKYNGVETLCNGQRDKVTDKYGFYQIGSYCRIKLNGNERIFWEPNEVAANKVSVGTFSGDDGFTYFQLPTKTTTNSISGTVSVNSNDNRLRLFGESVHHDIQWNGIREQYYIDGWGDTTTEQSVRRNIKVGTPTAQVSLNSSPADQSFLLTNLLFDLADTNGCVSERAMVNALNFAMQFHNITPNRDNRRNLIYALRRLGYLIAYKDPTSGKYNNQLVAPFVERTQYFAAGNNRNNNLYLIKGVFNTTQLEEYKKQNQIRNLQYKRPYEKRHRNINCPEINAEDEHPEYKCLPDLILFNSLVMPNNKWNCLCAPYAFNLIDVFKNMSGFTNKFLSDDGDNYLGHINGLPKMVMDDYNHEILCKNHDGCPRTHKYYWNRATGTYYPIPKHLARVYCENEKNLPVCVVRNGATADVAFVDKMGIPRVLDMAFCDLNLGLPDEHDAFVINHKISGLPIKHTANGEDIPLTHIKKYKNITLTSWLQKLSANRQNCKRSCVNYIHRWQMYIDHQNRKKVIILTHNRVISAFSVNNEVFIEKQGVFYQVDEPNRSVNELLSIIITTYDNLNTNLNTATPPQSVVGLQSIDII